MKTSNRVIWVLSAGLLAWGTSFAPSTAQVNAATGIAGGAQPSEAIGGKKAVGPEATGVGYQAAKPSKEPTDKKATAAAKVQPSGALVGERLPLPPRPTKTSAATGVGR